MIRTFPRLRTSLHGLMGIAGVLLLAACGSSGPVAPAPIESRTQAPAPVRPAGVPPVDKSNASRPPPAVRAVPGSPAAAESSAVRAGGVEVRPLDARNAPTAAVTAPAAAGVAEPPLTLQRSTESRPGMGASSGQAPQSVPGPAAATPPVSGTLKTTPRGTKRLFSNEVLAEMRAADPAPPGASPVAEAAPSVSTPAPAVPGGSAPPAPASAPAPVAAEPGPIELAWPLRGKLLEGFSEPRSMGLSIAAELGEPVLAAADGKVIFSGSGPRGYGNLIIVRHDADTLTVYAHNRALLAREGQSVRRGQKIAEVGDSGTDRPQLHFEVRRNGRPVDPLKLLPPQ